MTKEYNQDSGEIEHLLNLIDPQNIPRHVAVIMDGNGRWAALRGKSRVTGHRAGIESVRDIIKGCLKIKIPYLTLYAFSIENWKRPAPEVKTLMKLLENFIQKELNEFHSQSICLKTIGNIESLPISTQKKIFNAIELTKSNQKLHLAVALSYSGRNEIIKAIKTFSKEALTNPSLIDKLDESLFAQYLFSKDFPDPDLLIRTSGELRVSNFLLWQIAYSEIWVTPVLWPDFRRQHLYQAVIDYQKRERRFGAIL